MPDVVTGHDRTTRITWVVMAALVVVLSAVYTWLTPRFLSPENLTNLLTDTAVLGLLAVPATFLIMAGRVDLSVGATAALCGVVAATAAPDLGLAPALALAVLTGLAAGAVNGALVAGAGLQSFAATLGTMVLLRSLATLIPAGMAIALVGFRGWARIEVVPLVTVPSLVFLPLFGLAVWASRRGVGRRVSGIGPVAGPDAHPHRGDRAWLVGLFVVSGAAAAAVGLIRVSQLGTGLPSAALGFEIVVVAAVLLGGGRLTGGTGSVPGTMLAVLFLCVVDNGLSMSNVTPYVSQLAHAVFIVVALLLARPRRPHAPVEH